MQKVCFVLDLVQMNVGVDKCRVIRVELLVLNDGFIDQRLLSIKCEVKLLAVVHDNKVWRAQVLSLLLKRCVASTSFVVELAMLENKINCFHILFVAFPINAELIGLVLLRIQTEEGLLLFHSVVRLFERWVDWEEIFVVFLRASVVVQTDSRVRAITFEVSNVGKPLNMVWGIFCLARRVFFDSESELEIVFKVKFVKNVVVRAYRDS